MFNMKRACKSFTPMTNYSVKPNERWTSLLGQRHGEE